MAGGPGGSGGGVESASLLWAIVMSAFAGSCILLNSENVSFTFFF